MVQTPLLTPSHNPDYSFVPGALLVADHDRGETAERAIEGAGLRLLARCGLSGVAAALAARPAVDVIAVAAHGASPDTLSAALAPLAAYAGENDARLVIAITEPQIDAAAAILLGSPHLMLVEASAAEWLAACAVAATGATPRLNDATRDAEAARLQRLNEEVARIADTLARLTRGEDGGRREAGVRDPGTGYRGPEASAQPEPSPGELRAAIRARRLRAQFFSAELFADPAWDMLLDLFAAELEDRRVSVSSLCIAAAVPPTTALRWIGTMHDAGLFERHADPSDRRRAYIALSSKGLDGMRGYVAAVKRQGLAIA